jgi:hypothetical protein
MGERERREWTGRRERRRISCKYHLALSMLA